MIHTREDSQRREAALRELATDLSELARALAQAQQWERAKAVWRETAAVIQTIKRSDEREAALRELATDLSKLARALAQAHQWERAKAVWRETWETDSTPCRPR